MSIEEIAAKGILGLKAPPPKIHAEPSKEEEVESVEENANSSAAYATDVVSLAVAAEPADGNAHDNNAEDDEEVPISTDSLPVHLDDVPLPLDDVDEREGSDLISDGFIEANEAAVEGEPPQGTVAGSGSTEKENLIWPDDATHESVPDYTAQPKRQEIEPIQKEQKDEEVEAVKPMEAEKEPFEQPVIILDAPSTNADVHADDEEEDTPAAYEEVSAEEYAREFNIVLERCDDESGFASNDASAADANDVASTTVKFAKEDIITNPCLRLEPTFVGCTDSNLLFGASNPFDGTVIRTAVAFNYDLYLPKDAVVNEAVAQLEETMLRHVAGGMNFDRCGASDDNDDNADDGNGRLLAKESEEIGFVGLSSRPADVEDAAYQQCTSNLSIDGDISGEPSEAKCVPMKGKMTLYLSSKEDRFAAKHLINTMVKSGAEDGAFVGAGDADAQNRILGVAYVENRAMESAKLPGNNLEQFKTSTGMSGLAIGLVSFLGVFVGCFAFGLVGIRRHNKQSSERDDIFDEESDNADLVKGEDGSFPTFPQLAKITAPNDTESEVDLENPDLPIPTMTNTASSESLSVGSADQGFNADDSTVYASNPKEDEDIHCVPLPPPVSDADLSEDENNSISGVQTLGSMDFRKSEEESNEEDSLPCISTAGSMDFGTEMFSPIKFPGPQATGEKDVSTPESSKVLESEERRLKTDVLLGKSPPFYGA